MGAVGNFASYNWRCQSRRVRERKPLPGRAGGDRGFEGFLHAAQQWPAADAKKGSANEDDKRPTGSATELKGMFGRPVKTASVDDMSRAIPAGHAGGQQSFVRPGRSPFVARSPENRVLASEEARISASAKTRGVDLPEPWRPSGSTHPGFSRCQNFRRFGLTTPICALPGEN